MQPEGQGGHAEQPAGGAAQHLARPPDAEAAGQEVQEAKVKMNRTEKAVKGLQKEREVEEGEHRSTGELVLELKEVGE